MIIIDIVKLQIYPLSRHNQGGELNRWVVLFSGLEILMEKHWRRARTNIYKESYQRLWNSHYNSDICRHTTQHILNKQVNMTIHWSARTPLIRFIHKQVCTRKADIVPLRARTKYVHPALPWQNRLTKHIYWLFRDECQLLCKASIDSK